MRSFVGESRYPFASEFSLLLAFVGTLLKSSERTFPREIIKMVSMIFKLVPKSISQKSWYQKFLHCLRIYSFITSISGLILFIAYLIALGSTLTTAHGVVLAIAICCAVYTTITTVVICFIPSGGDIVDAMKYFLDVLFFLGWGANTIVLAMDENSCGGGGSSKRKRNDSDDGSSGCGVWGAVVAVSVLNV